MKYLALFFLMSNAFAEVTEILSSKYIVGHYLMYDCQDQHWVCTQEDTHKECKTDLENALKEKKRHLPCLLIVGEFKSNKLCTVAQKKYVTSTQAALDCLHPDVRSHFIEFQ